MKNKIALVLLSLIMVMSCIIPIGADNSEYDVYRWDNVLSLVGSISFDGSTGNYSMTIRGASGVDRITATATLYYKNANNKWIEVSTDWSYDVESNRLYIDEDFAAVEGRTYKVELDAVVYKDGYGESVSKTTTKTYE